MKLRKLLFLASLALPAAAHAFPFNTTITGGGNTIFFPNVGGPSNYMSFPRVNEIYASPLYVSINGGLQTQGSLTFFYAVTGTSMNDLNVFIPGAQPINLSLYGPDLITTVDGVGFYSSPGTYNLADAAGNPYTYIVTPQAPAAPEIDLSLATAGLTLLTGGIAVLRGRRVRQPS